MKLTTTVLTLALLIALCSSSLLWFDTNGYKYGKKDRDWNSLSVPVKGGSGDYDFKFWGLPDGWDQSEDGLGLLIPSRVKNGRYQVQVSAYDIEYQVDVNRYLLVQIDGDDVTIFQKETSDTTFDINLDFDLVKKQLYDYPSWKKIDDYIRRGDIKWLRMIVDRTIQSQNDCSNKESFLNAFLNRIEKYIFNRENSIKSIRRDIKRLQDKKDDLVNRLKKLQREKKNNDVQEIQDQFQKVNNRIIFLQRKIQQVQKDIKRYNDEKNQVKKKIWAIQDKQLPQLRKQLKSLEYQLSKADWKSKVYIQKKIHQVKDQIQSNQKTLKKLKQRQSWLEKKIRDLTSSLKKFNDQLKNLRPKADRLRKQLQKVSKEELSLERQIKAVKRQINSLSSQISKKQSQIQSIEKIIDKLQKSQKQFTVKINKHLIECRDVVVDFSKVQNRNFVATFNYNNYERYVKNTYGLTPSGQIRKDTIELVRVNFYSSTWIQNYGSPFSGIPSAFQGFGNNGIIDLQNIDIGLPFGFNDDPFQCNISGGSRQGKITKISKNEIFVASEGSTYILKVGNCSSLETSTGYEIPRVGDTIYWKGSPSGNNSYNVHSGLCQ